MVSWTGHVLPVVATILIWFFATGLVAWLDNREQRTFPRSLLLAGIGAIGGIVAIGLSMHRTTLTGVYVSLGGTILVWAWHEISFLTGVVTGPRRGPCPPGARGLARFYHAVAAVAWHEIGLALSALGLIWLCRDAPNQVGAMAFVLLLVMRLSTKLAIFLGVPNMSTDILAAAPGLPENLFRRPAAGARTGRDDRRRPGPGWLAWHGCRGRTGRIARGGGCQPAVRAGRAGHA